MASLWKETQKETVNNTKNVKKPSPMCVNAFSNSAQNSTINSTKKLSNTKTSIKRLSPSTLFGRRVRAGMTVEAAVVLPLCLFFLLNLSSAVEMIRLHNRIETSLWNTGSQLALYEYEQSDSKPVSVLTAFYVQNRLIFDAGKEYLDRSPLLYGHNGIQLLESDMLQDDMLSISVTYRVAPLFLPVSFASFRMANRFQVHLWDGYEIPENPVVEGVVYVTEYGEVYHTDRNCYHLKVTVHAVTAGRLDKERNADGKKYRSCKKCAYGTKPELIYVTREGDSYHYDINCSGLKRTVHAMTPEEAENLRKCAHCGAQN